MKHWAGVIKLKLTAQRECQLPVDKGQLISISCAIDLVTDSASFNIVVRSEYLYWMCLTDLLTHTRDAGAREFHSSQTVT